jgi:hypothetical protein
MKDIHDIVNHVAQELESDRRRMMIENYINRTIARVQVSTEVDLHMASPDAQVAHEVEGWKNTNKTIFAYKVAEAARIILRQELLGE